MVFSSVTFIFYFLPVFLLVYFLLPKKMWLKNGWVLTGSLFFYTWGEVEYVGVLLLNIILNYVFGLVLEKRKNKRLLFLAVGINLLLLIYYKYVTFIFSFLLTGLRFEPTIHLPLGISFFTFQGISYIVDVYRQDAKAERNPIDLGTYIAMFPQLIAGPIVRYKEIQKQIRHRQVRWSSMAHGALLFMIGFSYKVLLANYLGASADFTFGHLGGQLGSMAAWAGLLSYSFQIYFDFCGYSVMAVGLGKMIGFHLPINFRYPYISKSITEFWRRWHITLSEWFRDYLYIPLGGNRGSRLFQYRNLWIVFLLCGLWHGAQWTFVIWGVYHGLLLVVERMGAKAIYDQLPFPISNLLIFLFVTLGWVFFRAEDLTQVQNYFYALFKFSSGGLDAYYFGEYWSVYGCMIAIMAIVLSTPLISRLLLARDSWLVFADENQMQEIRYKFIYYFFIVLFFILAIFTLVDASYSPFIYYRF